MLIKRNRINRHKKFNFEIRNSFASDTLLINNQDVNRSLCAIEMLCEYIRSSYFEHYACHNKANLAKYCRLLLRFEKCNQSIIVKACKKAQAL